MATERRPYHRAADSLLHEPWTNDQLAFVCRLSALMHERWRTSRLTFEQASTVLLGPTDLMKVAGKLQPSAARALAERVAALVSCSIEARGALFEIKWPKWAEFQGLVPQNGESSGRERSPSASSVPRPRPGSPEEPSARERNGARSLWLNVLAKERGSEHAKAAFLEAELERIEAEAEALHPRDRKARNAKMRSLIIGWWRQRLRNPDGPRPRNGHHAPTAPANPQRLFVPEHERVGTPIPIPPLPEEVTDADPT